MPATAGDLVEQISDTGEFGQDCKLFRLHLLPIRAKCPSPEQCRNAALAGPTFQPLELVFRETDFYVFSALHRGSKGCLPCGSPAGGCTHSWGALLWLSSAKRTFKISLNVEQNIGSITGEVVEPVIPVALTIHQNRVNGVESKAGGDHQDIHAGRHKAWCLASDQRPWEGTAKARRGWRALLHKSVAAFGQHVDGDENHRRAKWAVVAGSRHSGGGVIHAAHHELGRQIHSQRHRILE